MAEYNKKYREEHADEIKEYTKNYRIKNALIIKERQAKWYAKHGEAYREKNIEKIRRASREWARNNPKVYFGSTWNERKKMLQREYRERNKEIIAKKRKIALKKKLSEDPNFKLKWLLRSRISSAIKKQLGNKAYKTIELLGCSIQEARNHLENQFTNGMNWKNHGKVWEIDHIIPVSSFDLTKSEEQKKAFNYNNTQPLIKWDNRTKGSKILRTK